MISVLALAASIVFIAPASAQDQPLPPGVEFIRERANGTMVYRGPSGFSYDNTTGDQLDYVVVQGGDMYDVCGVRPGDADGGLPPISRQLVKQGRNGKYVIKTPPAGVTTYTSVYKSDLPAIPDFFDAVCGGFFENGIPILAPFATGMPTLHRWEWVADWRDALDVTTPQGRGRYRNGVEGVVVDADGNPYDLVTVADFTVRSSGDIPDFNELSVTLTPQAD